MSTIARRPSSTSLGKEVPIALPAAVSAEEADLPIAKQPTPTRRRPKSTSVQERPDQDQPKGRPGQDQPPLEKAPEEAKTPKGKGKKTPRKESSAKAEDVEMEGENVDDLLGKDYAVMSRLLGSPKEHAPRGEGQFVEAVNKNGQKVFVELGRGGVMPVKPSDVVLRESAGPLPIPVSERSGLLASVGLDIAGVAVVCQNGVCAVLRTDGPIEERHYAYDGVKPTKGGEEPLVTMSYPIVRMADIVENPDAVLKQTDAAIAQLRKTEADRLRAERSGLKASIGKLARAYADYCAMYERAEADLLASIQELKALARDYKAPLSPQQAEKYRLLKFNLKKRYQMLDELMAIGQAVNEKISPLERMDERLDSFTKDGTARYSGLKFVIDE